MKLNNQSAGACFYSRPLEGAQRLHHIVRYGDAVVTGGMSVSVVDDVAIMQGGATGDHTLLFGSSGGERRLFTHWCGYLANNNHPPICGALPEFDKPVLVVGQVFSYWANQADRECEVFALDGTEALCMYTMPHGRQSLVVVDNRTEQFVRNCSVNKIPKRWHAAAERCGVDLADLVEGMQLDSKPIWRPRLGRATW